MIQAASLAGTRQPAGGARRRVRPWLEDVEPVPNEVCDQRANDAVRQLLPEAEKAGVYLNIENIFASGYLFSPQELVEFVDSFQSPHVHVHFDTGNIMQYQFPEHWIPILGKRIQNIHLKESTSGRTNSTCTVPPAAGRHDELAGRDRGAGPGRLPRLPDLRVLPSVPHYPEALIYQTSDALDRMLGRKQ